MNRGGHPARRGPARLGRRLAAVLILSLAVGAAAFAVGGRGSAQPTIGWGDTGPWVVNLQSRLSEWGYYFGPIDGYYGGETYDAVIRFQQTNGLVPDGIVGPATWAALGLAVPTRYTVSRGYSRSDDVYLLARLIAGEAEGEPFEGKVAVAAVILNRMKNPRFPGSIPGVVFQPGAFESVENGRIWYIPITNEDIQAAQAALSGWDPTYGSLYFWNPAKPVNPWVWTRPVVRWIGRHVFAR